MKNDNNDVYRLSSFLSTNAIFHFCLFDNQQIDSLIDSDHQKVKKQKKTNSTY